MKDNLTIKFFVDGAQVGGDQTGSIAQIFDSTAAVEIGSWTDAGLDLADFDGLIDDVRVWNVARGAAEIAADKDNELVGNEPGLVGYWRFNGGSLVDATANGNDLTNVNGATFSADVPFTDVPPPPPLTPLEQAEALIMAVDGYAFPKHVTYTYMANLKKVPRFIEEGKLDAAIDQLIVFADKVQRHRADGTISEAQADDLLARAQTLLLTII